MTIQFSKNAFDDACGIARLALEVQDECERLTELVGNEDELDRLHDLVRTLVELSVAPLSGVLAELHHPK